MTHKGSFHITDNIVSITKIDHLTPFREITSIKKLNSVALVRKRTIPTEIPPLVDEVSANVC
jgi:hypothetical protein